jgi:hypothetical protein
MEAVRGDIRMTPSIVPVSMATTTAFGSSVATTVR